jgi:hypothetical protein
MSDQPQQEIMSAQGGDLLSDTGLASVLAKAEIDQQIATARAFPRSWKQVQDRIRSLATLDVETALACTYRKPQGKDKAGNQEYVTGKSIRFAEIVASMYGNSRQGARVISINRKDKTVTAQGVFHDLETNSLTVKEVTRSIATRTGSVFSADMIVVAANAACSIAIRNAILAGVPEAVYKRGYEEAQRLARGDEASLSERRMKAVKAFGELGIKPAQVYEVIGVKGLEDIQLDELMHIGGIYNGITAGDITLESVFYPPKEEAKKAQVIEPDPDDVVGSKPGKKPSSEPKETTQESAADSQGAGEFPHDPETGEIIEDVPAKELPAVSSYVARLIKDIDAQESAEQLEGYILKMFKSNDFKALNELDGQGPVYEAAMAHPCWSEIPDGFIRSKIIGGH